MREELREVFDLIWYDGLTQREAADVLDVSERTVRSRWLEARMALREALGGQLPRP
jgi:RNA polymerase sigma factor (sigma-70 family)